VLVATSKKEGAKKRPGDGEMGRYGELSKVKRRIWENEIKIFFPFAPSPFLPVAFSPLLPFAPSPFALFYL